ncbi:MAG TPA: YetF domain-containing protein [Gammaproteobacteria bacterium]|nr:YetF domain-containing protein [Gammaproteobacteria bacterium]
MESIIRALCIYLFLMLVLRISGARTLNEMTTFDFVLLLIMGDASQQAMTGTDYSLMNGLLIITTLVVADILMSFLKQKFPKFEKMIDGTPILLMVDGKLKKNIMNKVQVDENDILEAARKAHGLETLQEIKHAILEKDGDITIVPVKN